MTRAEFGRSLKALFGDGYASRAAVELGVDRTTIWRWRTGASRVPGAVETLLRAKLRERGRTNDKRDQEDKR